MAHDSIQQVRAPESPTNDVLSQFLQALLVSLQPLHRRLQWSQKLGHTYKVDWQIFCPSVFVDLIRPRATRHQTGVVSFDPNVNALSPLPWQVSKRDQLYCGRSGTSLRPPPCVLDCRVHDCWGFCQRRLRLCKGSIEPIFLVSLFVGVHFRNIPSEGE